jgi:hypothetical protein
MFSSNNMFIQDKSRRVDQISSNLEEGGEEFSLQFQILNAQFSLSPGYPANTHTHIGRF